MRSMAAIFAVGLLAASSSLPAAAAEPHISDWNRIEQAASGQTVYFNAWGGSENINAYLQWVSSEMQSRYRVTVVQVKLDDTASAVAKVIAEKASGKNEGGSVDLIWINGENFVSMKQKNLLLTPGWATALPNWRYVDSENQPTILTDFTEPTEGLESPWGGAKMVFFYDSAQPMHPRCRIIRHNCSIGRRRIRAAFHIPRLRISLARLSSSRSLPK